MNGPILLACIALSITLAIGQVFFKLAAEDIKLRLDVSIWSAATSPWLLSALALYAAGTVLWIAILSFLPLSRAYPFALFGTALVPILAVWVLGEDLSSKYFIGIALVLLGLLITQTT